MKRGSRKVKGGVRKIKSGSRRVKAGSRRRRSAHKKRGGTGPSTNTDEPALPRAVVHGAVVPGTVSPGAVVPGAPLGPGTPAELVRIDSTGSNASYGSNASDESDLGNSPGAVMPVSEETFNASNNNLPTQ